MVGGLADGSFRCPALNLRTSMNSQTSPTNDLCSDCGAAVSGHSDGHATESRCPACFDRYLFDLDAGFLESYRRFGCRSRLVVAETCLRGLVLDTPEHRKVLAMTIFEQYVLAMTDLAGLLSAFRNRAVSPILKSFMDFRLDSVTAPEFFQSVQTSSDAQICAGLDLPEPAQVAETCGHLDQDEAYSVSVAISHLMQDLRKSTDRASALALAQVAGQRGSVVTANDTKWLNRGRDEITPDQVAMLVLDSRSRSLAVQGLTADENSMGQVIDAIDTVTRAGSNLIFAYLQTHDL